MTCVSGLCVNNSVEQARIAEEAGACAVMALERVPADIRQQGGVARMSDPKMIKAIMDAVSIPVMAKVRIGHFVEAQVPSASQIVLTYCRSLRRLGLIILTKVKC
jgi:pyridoxal biosynthesis lyase PdxS